MFAERTHNGFIELDEDDEKLYRLPPMSSSNVIPVVVRAFDAYTTRGPNNTLIVHDEATDELELELLHSNHFKQLGTNLIHTFSETHDDLWRLRVRRPRRTPDNSAERRQYRISVEYPSQLPVIERRIPTSFFHDGFEFNYNQQQYIKIELSGNHIHVLMRKDLAQLSSIIPEASDGDFFTLENIDISPASFIENVDMTSLKFDVGSGPHPVRSGNGLFFSVRADFPAVNVNIDVPGVDDSEISLPPFHITFRFFLFDLGNHLTYIPIVESNLLDKLDFDVPGVGNIKQLVKKKIEDALNNLQFAPGGESTFGVFIKPWLVGGRQELLQLGYAPSPGDQPRPDGIVEPATGELIVHYVGPRAKPDRTPVLKDPTDPDEQPVDDQSIRLFDLPDEEPDPVPGGDGDGPRPGDVTDVGTGSPLKPNIGALAKIDHIVVLMQENRSFDQVLGYLSRGNINDQPINPNVDGLLPPKHADHSKQVNFFRGREFRPRKADKTDPKRLAQLDNPEPGATAWPSFAIPGPCHETNCVLSQMAPNPEAPNIPMGNFVAEFARQLNVADSTDPRLRLVMDYFGPEDLPVYAALAREFGICDSWYTSHPGPTWPNRFVLLTGDLNRGPSDEVETDNPDFKTMIPLQSRTVFDILNEHGASWRVFEHGYSFLRLYGKFTYDTTNIVPFDDPVRGFEAAARDGNLPQVTLIEPDYINLPPGNDDQPPADMKFGQDLVNRIVRALIASPTWARTLFIITYDEHGGFYDHKQPPVDAPPLLGNRPTLGPRVPTFVISPLMKRGEVFKSRFDHASILATILRRFAGPRPPRVSPRVDAARDLREVLTLADAPLLRTDFGSTGLPAVGVTRSAAERSALRSRRGPIGQPDSPKEDFHWVLSAARMITGEPPQGGSKRILQSQRVRGQLLFYRDKRRDGTGEVANPAVIGLGGWQFLTSLFSGGNGIIYAVDQNGRLLCYQDKTQDGTGDVANPTVIGLSGWQDFKFLFSGGNGIIYAVDQNGRLLFHRDITQHGIGAVAGPSVIGRGGWQDFKFLFSGGNGIMYAVDQNGRLLFFEDKTQNGTGDVANPVVIGRGGWQDFKFLFSGGNGIIYAVDQNGRLLRYQDKTQDGTGDVANPTVIGLSGWQDFKFLFSGGNGIIYAVIA
jgi:phospholipase C